MQSLLSYNTFGIDCNCKQIYEPASVEELLECLPLLRTEPLLVIGGGSNLLLTQDFAGNVLRVNIKGVEVKDTADGVLLRCGAGEVWDDVVDYAVRHGYYDIENLSLIPGEVGASAVQNIGAYGMEAKDVISSIEAIEIATLNPVTIAAAECNYAYRYSKFKAEWKNKYIITHVTYKLSRTFQPRLNYGKLQEILSARGITTPTAQDVRDTVIEVRNEKLPDYKVEGNAGSFFMNPVVSREKYEEIRGRYPDMPHYYISDTEEKIPAGWMIEQCGWKGKTLGRAGVHSKQALVLVNRGGATGSEILTLCNQIRHDVQQEFGIDLHPEVNII